MKLFSDYKKVRSVFAQYKKENKSSLFSFFKMMSLVMRVFRKMAVLFLIMIVFIFLMIYFDGLNVFGTNLYFSFIVIYVYVIYIIINLVFLLKRSMVQEYDKAKLKHQDSFVRVLYPWTLLISFGLMIAFSLLELQFIKAYVNPPLAYCSYYDRYGNDLIPYGYQTNESLCNGVEIVSESDTTGTLKRVEVTTRDMTMIYTYQDELIRQRQFFLDEEYLYRYLPSLEALKLNRILIDIQYEFSDSFKETHTLFGFVDGYDTPVYEIVKETMTSRIVEHELIGEVTRSSEVSLLVEDERLQILIEEINEPFLYVPTYTFVSTINYPSDKEDLFYNYRHELNEETIELYNYAYLGDFETKDEYYLYKKLDDNLYVLNQNSKLKVTHDFNGQKKLNYENNNLFNYQVIRSGETILRMDQFKNNQLIFRHLFENEAYGYKVSSYSYERTGFFAFKRISRNETPYVLSIHNLFRKNPLDDYFDGSHTALFYQKEPIIIFLKKRMGEWD